MGKGNAKTDSSAFNRIDKYINRKNKKSQETEKSLRQQILEAEKEEARIRREKAEKKKEKEENRFIPTSPEFYKNFKTK
jgi:septal ring factor EnvC (AmiA/AmiB activator)